MHKTTADIVISRLPDRPILSPADVAAALGLITGTQVIDAINRGELSGIHLSPKSYKIARSEAVRWIRSMDSAHGEKNA